MSAPVSEATVPPPVPESGETTTTRVRREPQGVSLRSWADVGVIALLTLIGLIGLGTAFNDLGYLLAGVGGVIVGVGAAVLAHRYRLGVLTTAGVAVAAYFLLGSALAMPQDATLFVLPNGRTLSGLAVGAVYGWADLVTLRAPVSLPYYINAVPYLTGWLVALVGTILAVRWLPRTRRTPWRSALLLIGPAIVYLLGVLLGTDEPYYAAARGIAFAGIALVWLGWRRRQGGKVAMGGQSALLRRKLTGTAIIVLVAAIIGGTAGWLLAPPSDNRFVLREVVEPPFEPLDYPGPLSGFRHYTKDLADEVLFTVDHYDPDQPLRMSTMDTYDGVLWGVAGAQVSLAGSGDFRLVGKRIPEPTLATITGESETTVTVGAYDDVWLPSVGYPTRIGFDGTAGGALADMRYNAATGAAVVTSGVHEGMSYTVDSGLQARPDAQSLADVAIQSMALPSVENIPDTVTARATEIIGEASTPIQRLTTLSEYLATEGYLSHGTASDQVASRAGHGSDRMVQLVTDTYMVGDEEQYASLMALMARSLGYPARVVMGFAPEVEEGADGPVDVVGDDVTAWVEVPFEGVGWVPFYPTPDDTDVPQDQQPKPKTEPQPQVRQPPRTDNEQDDLVSAVEIDDADDDEKDPFVLPTWVIILGLSLLIPAAIVFVPMLIIALLKARRARRRRRRGGDQALAGAWEELLDRLSELGYTTPERETRVVTGRSVDAQLPEQAGTVVAASGVVTAIAVRTDEAVFSGRPIDPEQIDTAWREADDTVASVAKGVSPRRRLLARYRMGAARRWAARVARTATEAAAATRSGARAKAEDSA